MLYDKLDDVYIPEEELANIAKQLVGKPIYFFPRRINDVKEYIQSRIPEIKARLAGERTEEVLEDKSEEFLESLSSDKLRFVIISFDIAGSTRLSTMLGAEKYRRLIEVVLFEISHIVPEFYGHVLKYTGDGLIAYFPEPSFISKNDLALECALNMRKLVYDALNPILKECGYPAIDIRIGIDSGEACIVVIGSPKTKRHKDIIGAVVNLATKIQGIAENA